MMARFGPEARSVVVWPVAVLGEVLAGGFLVVAVQVAGDADSPENVGQGDRQASTAERGECVHAEEVEAIGNEDRDANQAERDRDPNAPEADLPRMVLHVSEGRPARARVGREYQTLSRCRRTSVCGVREAMAVLNESMSGEGERPRVPERVVVAEDQVLLREGIVALLSENGFDVVAQTGDAVDLLRRVGAHHPDVVITDVQMPPDMTDDGLRAARRIRDEHPGVGVLVLSQFVEERFALELIGDDARGVGYLLKDRVGEVRVLLDAVRRVAAGGSALDPEVVARMVGRRRREDPLAELTQREREVLGLMAEGLSNPGIAERLTVTVAAVEKHATRIFEKLGVAGERGVDRRVMAVLRLLGASP
jgi:DNA-binding NarL/FixJ family response regulator